MGRRLNLYWSDATHLGVAEFLSTCDLKQRTQNVNADDEISDHVGRGYSFSVIGRVHRVTGNPVQIVQRSSLGL